MSKLYFKLCKRPYKRKETLAKSLNQKPNAWSLDHTRAVQAIKSKVKHLPCLHIAHPEYLKIIQTDASEIGLGGILIQRDPKRIE